MLRQHTVQDKDHGGRVKNVIRQPTRRRTIIFRLYLHIIYYIYNSQDTNLRIKANILLI